MASPKNSHRCPAGFDGRFRRLKGMIGNIVGFIKKSMTKKECNPVIGKGMASAIPFLFRFPRQSVIQMQPGLMRV
ncbi:MAG: hypothetical protein ACO24Z_09270, partial [Arenimonas sp.]